MPADTRKINDYYEQSFGREPADAESSFISASAYIDVYVNENTDIKQDMSHLVHEQFNEQGALLYGNCAIMRYIVGNVDCTEEEITPLAELAHHFNSLYSYSLTDITLTTINRALLTSGVSGLFENTETWVALDNEIFADKERAVGLCRSLHTILTIIQKKFKGFEKNYLEMSYVKQWGVYGLIYRSLGFSIDGLNKKIVDVLAKIELKSNELQKAIDLAHAIPVEATPAVPKTIQDHFNERFIQVLDQNKIDELQDVMTNVITGLSALINKKKQIKQIEHTIANTLPFFDTTMQPTLSGPAVKQAPPTLFSAALNLLTTKVKAATGQKNKPINHDLEDDTANLMQGTHKYLNVLLIAEREQEAGINSNLSNSRPELSEGLKQASIEELETILNTNSEVQKAVTAYRDLSKEIINQLNDTEVLLRKNVYDIDFVDDYIAIHDDWKVWVSNLFAKLSSIFKTETARIVDAAHQYKQVVETEQKEYVHRINALNEEISTTMVINQPVVIKVSQQTTTKSAVDIIAEAKALKNANQKTILADDPTASKPPH